MITFQSKKMFFPIFTILFLQVLLFPINANAEVPPTQVWTTKYNNGGVDAAFASKTDEDGNSYITGSSESATGSNNYDFTTVKYNSAGNQLWVARYDGGLQAQGRAIAIDVNKNVYVTGYDAGVVTIKYDSNGNQLWVARYNNATYSRDIFVDKVGNIYVLGFEHGPGVHHIVKYNPNGNQLWTASFGSGSVVEDIFTTRQLHSMFVDDNENVYVITNTFNGLAWDYITVKYGSNGNKIWQANYGNGNWALGRSLKVDSFGDVFVTGYVSSSTGSDFVTIKYSPDGEQQWVAKYNNGGRAVDVSLDSFGNIYILGSGSDNGPLKTVKYSPNGEQLWVATNSESDGAISMFVDSHDGVYVFSRNSMVVRYDQNGNELWSTSNAGIEAAVNFGVDGSKNIYISGYGLTGGNWDYVTVKYEAFQQPSQFFSQVAHPDGKLKFRLNPGTKIPGTQTDKPATDVIKTVPSDWVLKVATTTDPITGNPIQLDGFQWYGVVDPTDGAVGWMAAKEINSGAVYLPYDPSPLVQTELEREASTTIYTTKEARIPVILQAVDAYYTATTSNSLNGSGGGSDGLNNFQTFIQGSTFPRELMLAIIDQESRSIKFNNEGCSSVRDGGIGIMQITSSKGSGSALLNKPKLTDCNSTSDVSSRYYSNALQGIYANIKDGFRILQDKFSNLDSGKNKTVDNITVKEMKAISTVYRYNQGSPYKVQAVHEVRDGQSNGYVWGNYLRYLHWTQADADAWIQKVKNACATATTFSECLANTEATRLTTSAFYLRDVGNKLISSSFGAAYENPTYGNKLISANNSQLILFLRSPAELRLMNQVGEITGSVNNVPQEGIANSVYIPEQKFITLFFPREQYKYRVVGLETGEYGLSADFVNNGEHIFFDADYIPTHAGEIHDYTIDWDKMSRCERGAVTLEIDYEGDGIIDRVVRGGCRITDIEPPVISIIAPTGDHLFNSQAQVQFTATDALSGVATTSAKLNGAPVINGQIVTLTQAGINTLEVMAMDNEGNSATATSTFRVNYVTNGFLAPIKADGTGVYNQGRTLPIKFELRDANNAIVPSVFTQLYVAKISNSVVGTDEIALSTSAADIGNQFRYDSSGHVYIFNLSTSTMSPGTWQVKAVLDSGQVITAVISVK